MELTKKIRKCPACNKELFLTPNMKFCPYCGEKLSEKEIINLEEIFTIRYIKNASGSRVDIYTIKNKHYIDCIENEITADEFLEYLKENSDKYVEIKTNPTNNTVYYINKMYLPTELRVLYSFEFDNDFHDPDGLLVEICLSNSKIKNFSISEKFDFYIGVGIGKMEILVY